MGEFRSWFERYERRISALAIISAFIIDSVTLERIDQLTTELFLLAYLLIVAGGIVIINLRESNRLMWIPQGAYDWLFIFVQFSFGGLFGRFFIYYSRSAVFATSWPFLVLFLVLLIGNEFSKKYYTRLLLQMSFFFLALFGFTVLLVPILIKSVSTGVFVLSSLISLAIMWLYVSFLSRLIPEKVGSRRHSIRTVVTIIFAGMNILYFMNIIPPIPLAVREAGVYHSIVKVGTDYTATAEERTWREKLLGRETIHHVAGEPIYVFSSIFAPAKFDTTIVHHWETYNEATRTWRDAGRITFSIVGGREDGYRGYTFNRNITPGKWRVDVETARGQTIGRVIFTVEAAETAPPVMEKKL